MSNDELDRLKLRVRRCVSLPTQTSVCSRLMVLLETSDVSINQIEQVVACDPALTTSIMRAATVEYGVSISTPLTLREATMRLGIKALKTITLAAVVKETLSQVQAAGFSNERFSSHSLAVAFLSRYLFARKFRNRSETPSSWTADEIYAIGLLHDIGYPLLATVAPEIYSRMVFFAKRNNATIAQAFKHILSSPLNGLAVELLAGWQHAEHLQQAISYLHAPWECEEEFEALSCLIYADHLANSVLGIATEEWELQPDCPPEVAMEFELSEEEVAMLSRAWSDHFERCHAA